MKDVTRWTVTCLRSSADDDGRLPRLAGAATFIGDVARSWLCRGTGSSAHDLRPTHHRDEPLGVDGAVPSAAFSETRKCVACLLRDARRIINRRSNKIPANRMERAGLEPTTSGLQNRGSPY